MSTTLKPFTLAVAALILGGAALEAQSVRAGPRGRPAATGGSPAGMVTMPVRRVQQDQPHRHMFRDRIPRHHGSIFPVAYFVPDRDAPTTHVEVNLQVVIPAPVAQPARPERPADGSPPPGHVKLSWKPGGITPVQPTAVDPATAAAGASGEPAAVETRLIPVFIPIDLTGALSTDWLSGCEQDQLPRQDRRRFPWGLGWLHRYGRDVDLVERAHGVPPSFYLRSPLLSGLYEPPDCPPDAVRAVESCALVTVVSDDDAGIEFEVPLPQLGAVNARELREAVRAELDENGTVILGTTDGEEFELMARSVRETNARSCTVEE